MLFKPGLTWFGRGVLTALTLGSTVVRDQAYKSAALDPTAIPALQMVLLLGQLPAMAIGMLILQRTFRRYTRRVHLEAAAETNLKREQRRIAQERLDRVEKRVNRVMLPLTVLSALWALTASLVLNQAVLIHRVFYADLAVCSPYLSQDDRTRLVAAFASMKSKNDHEAIYARLRHVASASRVELRDVSLW
jgi:hypothetical protein